MKIRVYMDELYARFAEPASEAAPWHKPEDIVEVPDELARAYFDTKAKHNEAWDALDKFIDGK